MKNKFCVIFAITLFFCGLVGNVFAKGVSASITLDSVATIPADRVVVNLTGNYTCGPLSPEEYDFIYIETTLRVVQAAGRELAHGVLYEYLEPNLCNGNDQPFMRQVLSENIPWHGGHARAFGNIWLYGCKTVPGGDCEIVLLSSDTDTALKIRGGGE